MKNKLQLVGACLLAGMVLTALPMTAHAASWTESDGNLFYFDDQGLPHPNSLVTYQGHVYCTGDADQMLTGWVQVNGAYCYFNEADDWDKKAGRLLAGGATPDGFIVNEQGQCTGQVVDDLSTILGGYESEDGGYVYYIGSDWWNMQELPYPVAATEKLDPATARPLVVAAAESLLGVPYVWGGEDATGVDCSGLTKYAYAYGVDYYLPHLADAQKNCGTEVSAKAARPGDLALYDYDGDQVMDHVALCIGKGQVIEASSSQNAVRIRSIGNPAAVRDVIGD